MSDATAIPDRILQGISSMATRQVLAELAAAYARQGGGEARIESVGGQDAAARVAAGEAFDIVVLAEDAIERLAAQGHVLAAGRTGLARSPVAIAVAAGAPRPEVGTVAALRAAVLAARRIGYSTGPSGKHLLQLFETWGIAGAVADRLLQAPPGVPVAALLARGEVELGFQQLSELMHAPGIQVLGPLPQEAGFTTTFSAAIGARCAQPAAAQALLDFFASPAADATKAAHGMEHARISYPHPQEPT